MMEEEEEQEKEGEREGDGDTHGERASGMCGTTTHATDVENISGMGGTATLRQ